MRNEIEAAASLLPSKSERVEVAGMPFDLLDARTVETAIRDRDPKQPFEYVVTPNVDHVVRNHRVGLRHLYDAAWISVCDSRILAKLSPAVNVHFPAVITGSDLTKLVLENFLARGDHVTVIGCDDQSIAKLQARLDGVRVNHFNPPMGFIATEVEVNRAVAFVVDHPSRYVFLAIGSPQQEKLAYKLKEHGATGIGFCIGASILFIVGVERRSPRWMQAINLEWLYRLMQNPRRLWRRYLVDDPLIFGLIVRQKFLASTKKDRS